MPRRQAIVVLGGGAVCLLGCSNASTETAPTSAPSPSTTTDDTSSTTIPDRTTSSVSDNETTIAPEGSVGVDGDGDGPEATETLGDPPAESGIDGGDQVIEVRSRTAWGARPPGQMVPHELQRMTLHHTAGPAPDPANPGAAILSHQRFHQDQRGWPDIAYHFLIGPAGEIFEGRSYSFAGDTGTNYDPAGHFLVSIDGDYSTVAPNDAQITAAAGLFAWASSVFGLGLDTLGAHRDYAATECPGDALYSVLSSGRLAAEIQRIAAAGPPELSYTWG